MPSSDPSSEDFTSDSSSIDDLIARRTGSHRLVTIPDFAHLSKSKQIAICARLQQLQDAPAVDADALHVRLRSLSSKSDAPTMLPSLPRSSPSTAPTSPPDLEEERQRDRLLEGQARKRLEQDGCPPCYPASPSFPAPDPPEPDSRIMSHWKTFPFSEGGVLCAQWKDWQIFRRFQERNRQHYAQQGRFIQFTDAVRERRRRHYLLGDVRLHPDPAQQNQLETWIEFQNYHLHTLEQLEKRAQVEAANLHNALSSKGAVASEVERAAMCAQAYRVRLASATERVESHKQLVLPWIEQQRLEMAASQITTIDHTGGHDDRIDTTRRTPIPGNRKRSSKARSILDPVRSAVSKPTPQKRSLRSQGLGASRNTGNPVSNPRTPQSDTGQTLNLRTGKPQGARQNTSLRPFRLQKVIKPAKRETNLRQRANSKGHRGPPTQPRKTRQQNLVQEAKSSHSKFPHQHPRRSVTTRSGRVSRRPEWPGFIPHGLGR
ncbi:MAG: hypothetical protein M1817_004020 [Caeruleum heppii]|nr:MAG: hypothetical protein M1817_004020 [Caeruleum heppii]